jgi:predicted RNA binding protein YcfA (HicA-like mRNA interferase family)
MSLFTRERQVNKEYLLYFWNNLDGYIFFDISYLDMNDKEIIKLPKQSNWQIVRVRGSHHWLSKGVKTVFVAVHGKKDLGVGLLKAIEKQTGVKLK